MNGKDLTSNLESFNAAQDLTQKIASFRNMRLKWERTWYDNIFFDDGHHFRYVSRQTNRVMDRSNSSNAPNKMRAIPKASKQIRGIANLLIGTNPHPVILPERLLRSMFPTKEAYNQAKEVSKQTAKKTGNWLTYQFEEDEILDKLVEMIILAAKESVSFMKVVPDPIREDIIAVVRDAFDVYLLPSCKSEDDSPIMAESVPVPVEEIWNNEMYDERARMSVKPDNQMSGSRVKDAYLRERFGAALQGNPANTATKNEGFIKEYLNEHNYNRIRQQEDAEIVLKGKKMGDPIIRQLCTSIDGLPLYDHYTTLRTYPYASFRFEPGYMYQVSQIERFIPSNKSLDAVVSRIEGFLHTGVMGIYGKKKGEGYKITNQQGAQFVEYENTPPTPIPTVNMPPFVFNFIGLLNSFIEEQGLSINTLAQIPNGVKAFRAIETLKESELNNLQIPLRQLKKTVKRISELYLQYADDYYTTPKEVVDEEQGDPEYYDVVGNRAYEMRKKLDVPFENAQDVIPIKKDRIVRVEIDNGAAFTEEGKKSQLLDLMTTLAPLFQQQILPPDLLKILAKELLDTFKTGSLQEITEALDNPDIADAITNRDIEKIKIAMLEVMKDATGVQTPAEETVGTDITTEAVTNGGQMENQPISPEVIAATEEVANVAQA